MYFIDSDVLLDLLLDRKEFPESFTVLHHLEKIRANLCTSPVVFSNMYYLTAKKYDQKYARQLLKDLRSFISIAPIDQKVLDMALKSEMSDFEDAIEYSSALHANCTYLVTRNIKDFPQSKKMLQVVNPKSLLSILKL